uniref:Uncharacterized protein n=1 Tax=Arundo donax TaxID=35708 RepID=A0A0A8XWR9_ARUDO
MQFKLLFFSCRWFIIVLVQPKMFRSITLFL